MKMPSDNRYRPLRVNNYQGITGDEKKSYGQPDLWYQTPIP